MHASGLDSHGAAWKPVPTSQPPSSCGCSALLWPGQKAKCMCCHVKEPTILLNNAQHMTWYDVCAAVMLLCSDSQRQSVQMSLFRDSHILDARALCIRLILIQICHSWQLLSSNIVLPGNIGPHPHHTHCTLPGNALDRQHDEE